MNAIKERNPNFIGSYLENKAHMYKTDMNNACFKFNFYRIEIFAIRDCVKEDHCDTHRRFK